MSPAVILRNEENREAAIRRIKAIRLDQENPLAVFIGPYKKIRTLAQNALYWKRIALICAATGHAKDSLHQFFKRRAFGVKLEEIGGSTIEVVPSSAMASRGDFSELIEHVEEFIAEYQIEESA